MEISVEPAAKKIILLNGPPGCGKDTAAQAIVLNTVYGGRHMKFATPLKEGTHAMYGMVGAHRDHFEAVKDMPRPEFFGQTPRQAYIKASEEWMKPSFGKDIYTKLAIQAIKKEPHGRLFVFSDCGFREEVLPLIEWARPENVLLIRLHREGCTFDGDSREYVEELPPAVVGIRGRTVEYDLYNRLGREDFRLLACTVVERWLDGELE